MSDFSNNDPIVQPQAQPKPMGWLQTWISAVAKPKPQTFIEISESSNAKPTTAYLWIFIVGTFGGIIQAVRNAIYTALGFGPVFLTQLPGTGELVPEPVTTENIIHKLATGIVFSPIIGLGFVILFAFGLALVHLVAKTFRGTGSYNQLLYPYAAITTPIALIQILIASVSGIPVLGACFGLVAFIINCYALVLQAMAVKGIHRFEGWGTSIAAALLPVIVFGLLTCLLSILVLAAGSGVFP